MPSEDDTQDFDEKTGLFVNTNSPDSPTKNVKAGNNKKPILDPQSEENTEVLEPSPQITPEKITIYVRLQDGNTEAIAFRVNVNNKLEKLIKTACEKFGITRHLVRFLYDGNRVIGSMTAKDLNIEEGDHIEIMSEQVAGQSHKYPAFNIML